MRPSKAAPFVVVLSLLGGVAGLFYAFLTHSPSLLAGMVYGFCIALCISTVERGLVFGGWQQRMRQWPTLLYIPACEVGAVVLVSIGFAIGGALNGGFGLLPGGILVNVVPSLQVMIYALVVSGALVFITRVRDLLGHAVFASLLLGRYHRPVEEERVFLFLDLVGSTAYARRHGDLRAQEYLGAIYAAIAEPVRAYGGAIDDYIGDMALITWPALRGTRDARCIRTVFAIFEVMDRDSADWQRRFGQVPAFRAALHGGAVVTAEVGIDRHKISYFGDVVNTTGRIETLSRELGASVLISAELLRHCSGLPRDIRAQSCGSHMLHGREQPLEVFSLDRLSVPAEEATGVNQWTGPLTGALAQG